MKDFTIDTNINSSFDLKSLNEDYIVIRKVSSDSIDKLSDQQFEIRTLYPNGRVFTQLMHTGAYVTPYTEGSFVELKFPIEDCSDTKITAVRKDVKAIYKFDYVNLKELLNDKTKKEDPQLDKVSKRVEMWVKSVTLLNRSIKLWTKELGNEIKIVTSKITISEDRTGNYDCEQLSLTIYNDIQIIFEPRGTYILGASGRIDIVSNMRFFGNYILVLQDDAGEKVWYLIENRNNTTKRVFNKSQLFKIIQDAISKKQ